MNTVAGPTEATAIAATGQTKAATTPRIKLLSGGFSIDHYAGFVFAAAKPHFPPAATIHYLHDGVFHALMFHGYSNRPKPFSAKVLMLCKSICRA